MSFQAHIDNTEQKTGLTPRQFIELTKQEGLDAPEVKAGETLDWLKANYDLGRGRSGNDTISFLAEAAPLPEGR